MVVIYFIKSTFCEPENFRTHSNDALTSQRRWSEIVLLTRNRLIPIYNFYSGCPPSFSSNMEGERRGPCWIKKYVVHWCQVIVPRPQWAWRHQMEALSVLLALYEGPVESPHKGQWRGALVFFYACLNKLFSKQPSCRWFETPSRSCNKYFSITIFILFHVVACVTP